MRIQNCSSQQGTEKLTLSQLRRLLKKRHAKWQKANKRKK